MEHFVSMPQMHGVYSYTIHISTRHHYIYVKGHVLLYPSRILHYTSWVFWQILMNLSSLVSILSEIEHAPKTKNPGKVALQKTKKQGLWELLLANTRYLIFSNRGIQHFRSTQMCSENMQQIYRRTPKYDFNKVAFFLKMNNLAMKNYRGALKICMSFGAEYLETEVYLYVIEDIYC